MFKKNALGKSLGTVEIKPETPVEKKELEQKPVLTQKSN